VTYEDKCCEKWVWKHQRGNQMNNLIEERLCPKEKGQKGQTTIAKSTQFCLFKPTFI
jgi:hypothetical protein